MEDQQKSQFNFSRIFEYCLFGLIFIVPIAFYPSIFVPIYAVKIVLVVALIVLFIASFLAFVLGGGIIELPKTKTLIPLVVFPFIAMVASIFSGAISKSVVGEVFELGTSGSFFILALLPFVVILTVKESKIGIKAILAFMFSLGIVLLHLFVRIFAEYMPLFLTSRVPNFLVGGLTDTAVVLGAGVIVAMALLSTMTLGKKTYLVSSVLLVFAMLFIGVAGFKPVVLAIGFFALMYFVYTFSWSVGSPSVSFKNRAIAPSLLVLVMSVVFVLSGSTLTGYVSSLLKTDSIEVRPNFSVTATLIGESWRNNLILGVGPNMFKELWDLHKPIEINATQFWAANFNFGSGFITTIAATTGVLGFLTLISFLVLFFWVGFKSVFSQNQDNSWRLVSSISFLVSLFLWVMSLFYPPSLAVVVVMFLFTGLAMSTLVPQGVTDSMKLNVFSNPKANFASVFVIVVLLISSIAGGYMVAEKAVAASMFQKSYDSLSMGDTESAKSTITNAIQLSGSDSYWRAFAEISLARAGVVLNSISSPENMSDSDRVLIQTEIASAVDGAREAISWNSKNYENWFTLGSIYEVLARSGIAGAIENAEGAFKEAETRAPLNPAIPLAFGRLAALNNDLNTAKENVSKAINLKQNYTDAYFTLAQIEVATNNVPGAIRSVEATTLIDPNNAALYFQLGLLKYGYGDYGGAANAFGRAVEIIPNYANAQYFLGLSYDRLGKRTEAVMIFEELYKTNPDSNEVALILSNLKAGRQPFSNAEPPIDPNPETRSELPLEE